MTNLATLIGVSNLMVILSDPQNTYVVIEQDGKPLRMVKNNNEVNRGYIIGVGNYKACFCLMNYLTLQKLAHS